MCQLEILSHFVEQRPSREFCTQTEFMNSENFTQTDFMNSEK